MKLNDSEKKILKRLLSHEHKIIANKLGFINENQGFINDSLLLDTIGLLDRLSRIGTQNAKKIVVTLSAVLWTYKQESWDGLNDFLILVLSRAGFPPSSIMVDQDYDYSNNCFSPLNSLINELSVTLHQFIHEIFIQEKKYLLTDFQIKVWNKMSSLKLLGISAPTSAGKSFIILLKAIELILKKDGNIIYIVPTLSLVAQVSNDFTLQLKSLGINDYRISTTYSTYEKDKNKIYVLTQEKAISAFSQNDMPFPNIRMLVVDEIQNIEKVANEDDQRAKTLFDLLIEFRYSTNPYLTVISGPRVNGLKSLGIEIFNSQSADEECTKDSPVASFTYAISKKRNKYFFNQYSDILDSPNRLEITSSEFIKGYGKAQYREDFIGYLFSFIMSLGEDSRNIIFSPTTKQARVTAVELSKLKQTVKNDSSITSLIKYIEETVHVDYDLCKTIPKGIAYHHGKVPTHIRSVLEKAIKDKLIENIVCTTTLMQGVNLPAQNVIIRNPDLAIKKRDGKKPKLSDYEMANLRGRAGRLLKDFIGRTFVLEEVAFEKPSEQGELFPEAEKVLHSGYGGKYSDHKREIDVCLKNNEPPSEQNKEYSFLLTYIRQIIQKHKNNALERLKSVGIDIEKENFNSIQASLASLSIPVDICYKNRYWDPIDLDILYQKRKEFSIPTSATDNNIAVLLEGLLLMMRDEFSTYFYRYCRIENDGLIKSASISAEKWLKEKTLKEILNARYFDTSDKIEDHISIIQNKISYGLPMLLKPIYDIKVPENMFLRFIEIGAYMPITRKMIELNIPRETAIYFAKHYFLGNEHQADNLEELIIKRLREVSPQIDYWRKVQIEGLL